MLVNGFSIVFTIFSVFVTVTLPAQHCQCCVRAMRLCNTLNYCLSVSKDTVFATASKSKSPYAHIIMEQAENSEVRIKGVKGQRYIAMDSGGRFYSDAGGSKANTKFMLKYGGSNNFALFSVTHHPNWYQNWYIGIDRNGQVRKYNDRDIDEVLFVMKWK